MKTKARNFELKVREWLYTISAPTFGWPRDLIYWFYPNILYWDADENGRYTIPAYISFYINPLRPLSPEAQGAFKHLVNSALPGPYDLEWHSGFALAIRRHISVSVQATDRDTHLFRFSTREYEELQYASERAARNGQAPGENSA